MKLIGVDIDDDVDQDVGVHEVHAIVVAIREYGTHFD